MDFRCRLPFGENGRTSDLKLWTGEPGAAKVALTELHRIVETAWRPGTSAFEAILIRMFSFTQSYLPNILRMVLNRKARRKLSPASAFEQNGHCLLDNSKSREKARDAVY